MSLPFSASSPPRPCILRRTKRVLGGPGIYRAVPRENRQWCHAPFSERRLGEARQKGEFPPFVGSFCIVRGRFHRFSLPLGIPACPNISPRRPRVECCFLLAWFLPWIYMFLVDVLVCSYLSNWMFPSAPTHVDVLVCSYLSNWMFPSAPTRGCCPVAEHCLREEVFRRLPQNSCRGVGPALEGLHGGVLTFCARTLDRYVGRRPFLCKEVLLLGAAACPGRPPWGRSHFLRFFFLWYIGCRQQREIRKRGWEWGLGGFLGRADAPSGMVLSR